MSEVVKFAKSINLDTEKLLGDWIVCIPGFTLQKYRQLQRSKLSIFSVNCFGGLISNTLGLPFRSPFVNLFLPNDDFINFLRYPRIYLEETPIYKKQSSASVTISNKVTTSYFPVGAIGNITLNMMHYKNFDDAVKIWNERKTRINWYNILAVMWTESEEQLKKFDELPYGKKVCFVPFKSDLDSAWYVEHQLKEKFPLYVHFVLETAKGNPFFYDPFDMLLYGKKTPLIKM